VIAAIVTAVSLRIDVPSLAILVLRSHSPAGTLYTNRPGGLPT